MRKFVIQIIGILSVILILLSVFDFTYTAIYKNANPRTKFQYLRSLKNTKVNYVFLGSSRVENGIDPFIIENRTQKKCINLGYEAAKLGDIYTVLQLLKSYTITTDTVFIQVDYIFDIKGHSINLPYEMAPFIKDNQITKEYLLDYIGEDASMYSIPFIRYCGSDQKIGFRDVFANLIGKKTTVVEKKGFSPLSGQANETSNSNHLSLPASIASHSLYYEKIKKYSVANNIKIIFFCAPFCRHTKNLDYVGKLKNKIPDLYDFSTVIQEDSLFVNCFHLNEIGAHKFTEILVKEIINNKNKI
jgi:hypothetical protein